MAKYRGDSEDWLDSKLRTGKVQNKKSKKAERGTSIPLEETNATVVEIFPNQCRVRLDAPEGEVPGEMQCHYRRAQLWGAGGGPDSRERSPVCVGDRVKIERIGGPASKEGIVEGLGERRNRLARPAPGRNVGKSFEEEKVVHVIVSNLDRLVIVTSAASPEFSMGIVDRFLVAAASQSIEPVIVVNKMDLFPSESEKPWPIYSELGVPVFELCAKTGLGLVELNEHLAASKVVAFCGHSGVGKTSVLRKLTQDEAMGRIGDVNEFTGKGKHTTTSAVVVPSGPGRFWIDTPGIKEFGLMDITPDTLATFFPEFTNLECTRAGCIHDGVAETPCQAEELPRLPSYRRILDSLREGT